MKNTENTTTIKVGQLVRSVGALKVVCNEPLPIITAFKLKHILKQLESSLDVFNESKSALIKKYGTLEETGEYIIPSENLADAEKEFQALLNTDLSFNIEPIKLDEAATKNVRISASDLLSLDWLIEEPE